MEVHTYKTYQRAIPPTIRTRERRVNLESLILKYGRYVGEDNKEYFYFNGRKYSAYEDCITAIIKWLQQ